MNKHELRLYEYTQQLKTAIKYRRRKLDEVIKQVENTEQVPRVVQAVDWITLGKIERQTHLLEKILQEFNDSLDE